MATITLATWNMNQQASAWDYLGQLRDEQGAQVALVQEAIPPAGPGPWSAITPNPEDKSLWRISVPPDSKRRNYASAVVLLDSGLSFHPQPAIPLAEARYDQFAASHPGQFAVARVGLPGGGRPLALVSLYGVWHQPSGNGAEATVHRAISDLTPLFLTEPGVVIAGDLNIFRNTNNEGQVRFDTVFTRLDAYHLRLRGPFRSSGRPPLQDCTCGQGADACDHVETFRLLRENARPYQDDYVFTSETLNALSCKPVYDPEIRQRRYSDHWPVVTRLAVG
jgi:endonuclease/exonuclease/phosphatase family metal-dependent hydrolase